MTGTRIVVDGLWRCLCPAVDAPALLRAVNAGSTAPPVLWRSRRAGGGASGARLLSRRSQQRLTAVSSAAAPASNAPFFARGSLAPTSTASRETRCIRRVHSGATTRVGRLGLLSGTDSTSPAQEMSTVADDSDGTARPAQAAPSITPPEQLQQQQQLSTHALIMARPPYRRELAAAPTPAIYAALRQLQDSPAALDRIDAFARHLLDERREPPTAALYEALVRANCHTSGSADAVRDVLRALKEAKIEGTPSLYHGALQVLAVHPDYLLRSAVLQEMRERWIDLTPGGMQSVAVGLLRDGQYERALDQLEAMTEASAAAGAAPVPPWLLDVYIYVLGQEGFLDDALKIVNHRLLRDNDAVPLTVWSFLLDACCRRGHYEGLTYVWNRVVRPSNSGGGGGQGGGMLTPSDATALDVLNVAARHGDANLAAAVMQMLAARGTKLSMPHFEAMLDCYARAGAVGSALQALCIMHNAGIVPDQGSTRSIFLSLTGDESIRSGSSETATIDAAVASLFDLKKQYGSVPIAAFNVVVEAMLERARRSSQGEGEGASEGAGEGAEPALDLYRHVRQICPAGPNRATFRLLFRGCADPQHLNFLAFEMRAFGFQPDADMIDRVVYENARRGSLEQALRHVFALMGGSSDGQPPPRPGDGGGRSTASAETLRRQPWISRRTAAALAKRCIAEEDERIWAVADASRERGRPMDAILREAAGDGPQQQQPRAAARNAYGVPHAIDLGEEDAPSPSDATISG